MTAQDRSKAAMVDKWAKAQATGDYPAAARAVADYDTASTGVAPVKTRAVLETGPIPYSSTVPGFVHVTQQNGYYCGPASGLMILKMSYNKKSRVDGSSPSQNALANGNHMRTAANRKTDWGSGLFAKGLNKWTGKSTWYVQLNSPSVAQTKNALTWSIHLDKKPVAADTVEMRNGAHYNGHPRGSTIGHWIIAYSYTNKGARATWADPAAPTIFPNAKRTFSADTASFNTYLRSNGIAY
jgi:hypothetical protein